MYTKKLFFSVIISCIVNSYIGASLPAGIIRLTTGVFANGGQANCVKVDALNRIVVCGYTRTSGILRWTVARFKPNGSLDTSFATGGVYQDTSTSGIANVLVINNSTSDIYVGGTFNNGGTIMRFNTSGSLLQSVRLTLTIRYFGLAISGSNLIGLGNTNSATNIVITCIVRPLNDISIISSSFQNINTATVASPTNSRGAAVILSTDRVKMLYGSSNTIGATSTSNNAITANVSNSGGLTTPFIGGLATPTGGNAICLYRTGNSIRIGTFTDTGSSVDNPQRTITTNTNTTLPYSIAGSMVYANNGASIMACGATTNTTAGSPFISKSTTSTLDADTSFAGTGFVDQSDTLLVPGVYASLDQNSNGQTVVVGSSAPASLGGLECWVLARYNSNGTLDDTFGEPLAGVLQDAASPFSASTAGLILTTTIDQNGKLLAGGNSGTKSQLTRYNVTGSPRDTSFSGDGVAYGDLTDTATINKVINNGTGYLVAAVSNTNQFTTASYDSAGSLNSGYGTSGIVQETGVGVSAAYDIISTGTGLLSVSGYTNSTKAAVINYGADGIRNSAIGNNGLQTFKQYSPGVIYGISTTTGTKRYGSGQDNGVAFVGLLADETGVLQDTAAPFDTNQPALIYSTTITQTGNILAAAAYNSQWNVISYTSAGIRTPGFGSSMLYDGIADEPGFLGTGSSRPRAIAIDSTNRIITTGISMLLTVSYITVVRHNSDGTIDDYVQETGLTTGSGLGILMNDDDTFSVVGYIEPETGPIPIILDYDSNLNRTNIRQFDDLTPGYFFAMQITGGNEYAAGSSNDTALLYPLLDGTGLLQDTELPFDGDHNGRIYSGCINENDIITLCGNFNSTWMVVQYTGVGERSITFNTDGVILDSTLGTANAYAIIQDSSGNFYVAGESTVSGTTVLTVAKYNSAGALVTTFGTNGIIQETRFGQSRAFNLALNPNGSLLIAGQITVNGTLYAALLAYDTSGQPIMSFGTNGAQTYEAFGAGALYSTVIAPTYAATSAGQTGNVATLVQTSQDSTAAAYIHSGF